MRAYFSLLLLLFFLPQTASAASPTLARVEEYLNGLTTIQAQFTQVAPDGAIATGKFYLQRPGKMRWEYNPPTPIVMVSNGGTMTYFDRELAQTSYIPISDTPAGMLVREHIALSGDIVVKELQQKAGVIRVTLLSRDKPDSGELTLEFSDQPLMLRTIAVLDAAKQETRIAFSDAVLGQPIDSDTFTLRK